MNAKRLIEIILMFEYTEIATFLKFTPNECHEWVISNYRGRLKSLDEKEIERILRMSVHCEISERRG